MSCKTSRANKCIKRLSHEQLRESFHGRKASGRMDGPWEALSTNLCIISSNSGLNDGRQDGVLLCKRVAYLKHTTVLHKLGYSQRSVHYFHLLIVTIICSLRG